MKNNEPVLYVLIAATLVVLAINQLALVNLGKSVQQLQVTGRASASSSAAPDVIPKGVPAVYGAELGVSYDDVSGSNPQKADTTINKLAAFDTSIKLSGDELQRYIDIASQISCEYCCGAPSVIFTEDTGNYKAGDAACSCAHSYAMRGVAKYLITKHSEFSDGQILEEMAKWKTLFFPDQITQKAQILQKQGIETNYINLASNKYRGIEQDTSGGMVGGC